MYVPKIRVHEYKGDKVVCIEMPSGALGPFVVVREEEVKKAILRHLDHAKTDKERNVMMVLLLDASHNKELRVILEGMLRSLTYSSPAGD